MRVLLRFVHARWHILVLGVCLLPVAGCSLLTIKQQAEFVDQLAVIRGTVEQLTPQEGVVNVALYRRREVGLEVVRKAVLASNGRYEFNVEPGTYLLGASIDTNHDGAYQKGEHATYVGAPNGTAADIEVQARAVIISEPLRIAGPLEGSVDIDESSALSKSQRNTGRLA